MPRALLSVSDKTGLVDLGRGLIARGFTLVSTGGTARALAAAGLPVTAVSDLTGFPEILDGRVKTLHPALHGGILARRDRPDHLAAVEQHGIALIDVVVVNLYPFVAAASNPAIPFETLIEEIDIGGPSLIRAAAKNFQNVLVVIDPSDYSRLLNALDHPPTASFRFELACKAFAHTASYDNAIATTLQTIGGEGDDFERRSADAPLGEQVDMSLRKLRDLRYGENPHQRAAWYVASRSRRVAADVTSGLSADRPDLVSGFSQTWGFGAARLLQGRELSFTNLLDLDAAARIVLEFDEPAATVVKHTNPCGTAVGESAEVAYVRARDADRLAAFGGIVALNRQIDVPTAEAIVSTRIDAVVAPAVDEAARDVLGRKAAMRVVIAAFDRLTRSDIEWRSILGALLAQERDVVVEARNRWTPRALPEGFRVVTKREPTAAEWEALRFAWRVCAHVKSNTVIFCDAQRTLAIGAGQMSRVDAVNVAILKAPPRSLTGSVAASDAFFPFRDGLDAVVRAGATAVVQPGGSVRDDEVIAAADEHGLAMVFTGRRHFKH
jgi:phosphoribosylaminoimidazolecarboxamide formyltransferase / IMP cyclohydrolase